MNKNKRTIIISVVCFSITLSAGQNQSRVSQKSTPYKRIMKPEDFKKWLAQLKEQEVERQKKNLDIMKREAWKRLLHVTEQQWRFIEPKHGELEALYHEKYIRAAGHGGRNEQGFRWHRRSKAKGGRGINAKNPEDLTEGEKLVEELIDLLEDEKSTDEVIRQKLDALQKAAVEARNQLPKARMELKKVLTSPRQEAIFLLLGYID